MDLQICILQKRSATDSQSKLHKDTHRLIMWKQDQIQKHPKTAKLLLPGECNSIQNISFWSDSPADQSYKWTWIASAC